MECESVSNRTRSGTPCPGHAALAATRALPAAYVRGRHTALRHARQLALRSGVSGIRRILGCLCLCGRTPLAIRHHNMQPDSGTRSLAADVCLHMPYITSRVGADLSSRVLPKAKAEEHSQPTTVLSAIISRDSTWRRETFAPLFDLRIKI